MDDSAQQLLKLRRFATADRRSRLADDPPTLSFVADERERIGGVVCAEASVICVVEGEKEIWRGERSETFPAGTAVVLPRGWTGDIVNVPDGRSGFYRAVVLIFSEAILRRAAGGSVGAEHAAVAIDAALGEALLRALEGLASPEVAAGVAEHRVAEVVLLLVERGALDLACDKAVGPRLRAMVRTRPGEALTLADAAARLAMSPATIKRRLAAEGTSFGALTAGERMALADELLAGGGGSLTEIAGACGYRSASKFSRRFRAVTGRTPDEARRA